MPWVLHTGFGMGLTEAQAICADKLRVVQPFGRTGKLSWQTGSEPVADWGEEKANKLFAVAENLRTIDEFLLDRTSKSAFASALSKSRRLVFLGCDFTGSESALLFEDRFTQPPEALVALREGDGDPAAMVRVLLAQKAGIAGDAVLGIPVTSSWKALRDYATLLES